MPNDETQNDLNTCHQAMIGQMNQILKLKVILHVIASRSAKPIIVTKEEMQAIGKQSYLTIDDLESFYEIGAATKLDKDHPPCPLTSKR